MFNDCYSSWVWMTLSGRASEHNLDGRIEGINIVIGLVVLVTS